jgi:hypothetical protein
MMVISKHYIHLRPVTYVERFVLLATTGKNAKNKESPSPTLPAGSMLLSTSVQINNTN